MTSNDNPPLHESTSKANLQPKMGNSKELLWSIVNLLSILKQICSHYWSNEDSLQPLGWLQIHLHPPENTSKAIFNPMKVLSKVYIKFFPRSHIIILQVICNLYWTKWTLLNLWEYFQSLPLGHKSTSRGLKEVYCNKVSTIIHPFWNQLVSLQPVEWHPRDYFQIS